MKTLHLRLKSLGTALVLALISLCASGEERVEVVKTDIDRSDVSFDRIDSENIEISASFGMISIEDFDTSTIASLRIGYHLNERLFFELSASLASGDRTSFEELSGSGTNLITDSQRDYESFDLSAGINLFPGETWLMGKAYSSDLYLLLGTGATDFGGSRWTTINLGVGYRLYMTDWIALRLDLRDHIFNRDIFGEDDVTNNIEMSLGTSIFF